jgi:hypothetical protein
MIRLFSVLITATLFYTPLLAQKEETLFGARNWGFSGIWGGYAHQYTKIGANESFNRTGFFNFEFGKSLNLGWGYNSMEQEIPWEITQKPLRMRWAYGHLGYAFLPYKAVHPLVGIDFGRGSLRLDDQQDRFNVVAPFIGVEMNVFRWFRVGLEGGYRFVREVDIAELEPSELSGPFANVALRFGLSWGKHHQNKDHKLREENSL